ncbi:MAG TPA: hypothetical protein VJ836_01360 [Candidatus Saccharimonadales bacterium]|nr:hypothetical protein [Candidatus Saccharimonadales bacterium]
MEAERYDKWLATRDQHRQFLFGEDLTVPYREKPPSFSLASLALVTNLQGSPGRKRRAYEAEARVRITSGVIAIVKDHEHEARKPNGSALFSIPDPDELSRVAGVAARVVLTWDRACWLDGRESPFAELPKESVWPDEFERADVQLVVETASAVCEVLQAGYRYYGKADTLANLVAKRGPEYAKAWVRGDIIRAHCEQWGYDAELWLRAVPPVGRAAILLSYPRDPLDRVRKIVNPPDAIRVAQSEAYARWLEARKVYRDYLFKLPEEVLIPSYKTRESLATLANKTELSGIVSPYELEARATIATNTLTILERHNELARDPEADRAILGIVRQADVASVAGLTAHIIWLWRRTSMRQIRTRGLPFAELARSVINEPDFADPEVQLTIETASAVCEVIQAGYPYGGRGAYRSLLASFIAKRGPEYAKAWMRGDVIREYCAERGLHAGYWLSLLPPGRMADIAVLYSNDPIARMRHVVYHFVKTFPIANLVKITGWNQERVREVLPMSALGDIAVSENDPVAAIKGIVRKYETVVTVDNLSKELALKPEKTRQYFPKWARIKLARRYADPLGAARNIAALCEELTSQYHIPARMAAYFAHNHPNGAHARMQQAMLEQDRPPRGVGKTLWTSIVARYPNPADKRRTRDILAYRLWQEALKPGQIETPDRGEQAPRNRTPPTTQAIPIDPGETLPGAFPSDLLLYIARRAGVTPEQLDTLLSHFAAEGEEPDIGELQQALEKLRQAAAEE